MPAEDPDFNLWAHVQKGDESRYELLRHKYHPLVERQLHKRLDDVNFHDLQDLEQEVWIAIWTRVPSFRGDSTFSTWVVAIARRIAASFSRHKIAEEHAFTSLWQQQDNSGSAERPIEITDRLALQEALANLIEPQRQALHLRYFETLTDSQIAKHLSLPLGTVKGRIHGGIIHLRRILNPKGTPTLRESCRYSARKTA